MTWVLPLYAAALSVAVIAAAAGIIAFILAPSGDEPPDATAYSIAALAASMMVGLPGMAGWLVLS